MFLLQLFVEAMLPIGILVAAGGWWRSHYPVSQWLPLRVGLNQLVMNLFTPVLLFGIAAGTRLEAELLVLPLLISVAIGSSALLLYVLLFRLPWFLHLPAPTRATLMLCGTFGNTFYLGIPILQFLYGPPALRYPAFTDMIASIPLAWSFGVWMLVRLGRHQNTPADVSAFRIITRLPLMWAFVLGLLANVAGLQFPPLLKACHLIGGAAVPIMLFIFGLSIPWATLRPTRPVLAVCVIKLAVGPLAVWAFARMVFPAVGEVHAAAIIEAAMPTFLSSIVMAERFGGDVEAAALTIGWSKILLWLTLPLILSLLQLMPHQALYIGQ